MCPRAGVVWEGTSETQRTSEGPSQEMVAPEKGHECKGPTTGQDRKFFARNEGTFLKHAVEKAGAVGQEESKMF